MKHAIRHIHFVGIGGSGMSGIAEVLLNLGYVVSGSDASPGAATQRLQSLGAQVYQDHAAGNIARADALVVSSAIRRDNPELVAARARRIPIVPRAEMLAELMRLKNGIAIAGTHGKTTTTSLVASVLAAGGLDPTFVIGGRLNSAGVNARLGSGEFIVVEADESDASFLHLSPMIAVVTNIDNDHMETYGHDMARLRQAFVEFIARLPFYGRAVLCFDDRRVREILPLISKPVLGYGFGADAQIRAVDVRADGTAMRFTVERENGTSLAVRLNLPGEHNVRNALAAIAVAQELGVPDAAVLEALDGFKGVGRRFARMGEVPIPGGAFTLIDDYGHHPVEIAATLGAARGAFPGRRVVLVFQPHRYTRTRDCFEDFIEVLSHADALLLTEVYAAGETAIVAADGRSLARALRLTNRVEPIFVENIDALPKAILDTARPGDVVITMGAGSIGAIAQKLLVP
ncbi:UDP-N-acetylmuramate:L-alanine ligase [Burkholderiales bacterium]|jgi:UDP-N-acetylmuramate--alanine ligase|nr:UDP-N-acetylmuramate:L-alanine ligase [Burkholderiales bacterium]